MFGFFEIPSGAIFGRGVGQCWFSRLVWFGARREIRTQTAQLDDPRTLIDTAQNV